ncbi:MAG: AAA family ATPase, partial [Sphingomonas bacterium]|nr:AAA family ATPase [Sphingomonas bacterium]
MYDIQGAELQFKVDAADRIALEGNESASIAVIQAGNSPLDRLNHLLAAATLPIRALLANSELRVRRGAAAYSLARSSDGESSALFIISVVLSSYAGTIFIIDEPELHLHRSIVVPLLAGLIRERPDCYFLISTHELELPTVIESSAVIAVRSCNWSGETVVNWDVDVLPASSEIPEDLRVDVLGSQRRILFVEGENSSLDQPMYALLFPKVSVRHKRGCKEVRNAVVGLRATFADHAIEPFGLVDNDEMSPSEKAALEADAVYALGVFTVESLYCSSALRNALAVRQADTHGVTPAELLQQALEKSIESLGKAETLSHLAARLCERTLRGKVLGAIPDRNALVANTAPSINMSFQSPYP